MNPSNLNDEELTERIGYLGKKIALALRGPCPKVDFMERDLHDLLREAKRRKLSSPAARDEGKR